MRGDASARQDRIVRGDETVASIAILTFVDKDGREWIAGASLTRARPKGAGDEAEALSVQLTEDNAPGWSLTEFRIVEP